MGERSRSTSLPMSRKGDKRLSIYIPSYKQLAMQYEYDAEQPFDEQIVAEEKLEGGALREVTIRGADGEPIPIALTIPEGPEPFPVLIYDIAPYDDRLIPAGVLGVKVTARLQRSGRHDEALSYTYSEYPAMVRWAYHGSVLDYRRVVDYLLADYPVAADKIGFVGCSKRGIMGGVLGGVEERIGAFVLRVCGADWVQLVEADDMRTDVSRAEVPLQPWYSREFWAQLWAPVDPKYFVDKIAPRRILFQFGKKDDNVPNSSSRIIADLAGEPKEVLWYDAGHGLIDAGERPIDDSWEWLCKFWGIEQLAAAHR